jgi:tetratricopeptide (TPR) repeat protein
MQAMGRADLALRCYDIAYRHGQVNPCAWHLEEVAAIAAACASLLLQIDGKHAEAAQLLGDAIESDPSSMRLGRQLLRLLVDEGNIDEALAQLDALPAEIPNREALRTAIRGACLVSKQNWIPAFAHLQTAYEAGCRDAICLRALTVSLFAGGQLDAAERMAHTWRQHAPRDAEAGTYLEAIALRNAEATEATPQGAESSRTIRVDPALAPHAGSTPAHYPVGESVRPGFSEPIKRIKDA